MDTNYSTYNRDLQMQKQQQEQQTAITVLVIFGIIVGTIAALLINQENERKRKHSFRGRLERGLEDGLETTMETVNRLEKEFNHLRRRVENGIGDLR
jgi:predicted RNase H-like nuclease (RuvC/YqgF family)